MDENLIKTVARGGVFEYSESMPRASGKGGKEMLRFLGDLLRGVGGSCMGAGGFLVDEEGRLVEEYGEDEEDWPEEIYSGHESQDGEDIGWSDCIWSDPECGRT